MDRAARLRLLDDMLFRPDDDMLFRPDVELVLLQLPDREHFRTLVGKLT